MNFYVRSNEDEKQDISVKTVVAIGIGAAVFVILGRFCCNTNRFS